MSEILTAGAAEYLRLLRAAYGRPKYAGNRRTVRIAAKPYHWRESDGRLQLIPGESPWEDPA